MDELTLLRRVRADVEEPSAVTFDAGRAALEAAWATDAPRKRCVRMPRRHRGWRRAGWTAGGVAVAFGLAAVLVLTNVVGLAGWRGGASPAAASVLNAAADVAAHESDPVVPPGGYLKIETDEVFESATADRTTGEPTAYLAKTSDTQYVPADRSKTWIWIRPNETVYRTFGAASQAAAKRFESNQVPTEWVPGAGGCYYSCPPVADPVELSKLPTDPTRLLNYIYVHTLGQGSSRDGEALAWIADRLRGGTVPADIRAAMFRAAAEIPGVQVSDRLANLDGRTGVAVGYIDRKAGTRQDIIVDPSTGGFIGEREVLLKPSGPIPAGTADDWTSVTTSVVASAPRGTADGGFDSTGCTRDFAKGYVCPNN